MPKSRNLFNSLTARIVGLTVLVAVIATAVTASIAFPLISQGAQAQAESELNRVADVSQAALRSPVDTEAVNRLRDELETAGITAYIIGARLAPVPGLDSQVQEEVLRGRSISGTANVSGADVMVAGRPLQGGLGLVLLAPADAGELAGDNLRTVLIALLAGLVVAVVIGLLAARRLTRPLRRAAEAAERMSTGEREVRLESGGPEEISDIAISLNQLGDSLALSEGRQRDFLLSVSHELRTPLTAIRGYAEALSDGLTEDPAEVGSAVVGETRRLERLVADLLDLARLGAVDMSIELTETDLVQLVQRAAQAWVGRFDQAGVVMRVEVPEGSVAVRADQERVRQILDNLIENALRMTPEGQPVVLAVTIDDRYGALSVRDGGVGLTEADMAVAFEPAALFSRYQGVRKVGTGVGLALVGRLADRMSGVAQVWSAPEGGAAFGVWLPLMSTTPSASPE